MSLKFSPVLYLICILNLLGCSQDGKNLSLNQQSIDAPNRFDKDHSKDGYRNPLAVLDFSEISRNMSVVDLLGGGGYYSELFSYILGASGKVYLQNNSLFLRFSKDEIEERLEDNRLTNLVRLDTEYTNLELPKNVDIIFLGLSFHDFFVKKDDPVITAIPEDFYRQIKEALKPSGTIIIIDHSAKRGSGISTTSKLHRIDEDWVKSNMRANGFEFIDSIDSLRNKNDDFDLKIWNSKVFHKTDRFIHKYRLTKDIIPSSSKTSQ